MQFSGKSMPLLIDRNGLWYFISDVAIGIIQFLLQLLVNAVNGRKSRNCVLISALVTYHRYPASSADSAVPTDSVSAFIAVEVFTRNPGQGVALYLAIPGPLLNFATHTLRLTRAYGAHPRGEDAPGKYSSSGRQGRRPCPPKSRVLYGTKIEGKRSRVNDLVWNQNRRLLPPY
ncbi:hypothetical protein ACJJTC_001560 [Scirpophaga incertulas]